MKTFRIFVVCALFLTLTSAAQAAELVVSAAISLTNALEALKPIYEKAHPETKLVFNFGSSGALLKQIEAGAPSDVFASADQPTMDKAQEFIVPESRINFVANALVLIVPAQGGMTFSDLKDLQNAKVERIAIGNPESVPAGRYAKTSLTAAGIYDALTPKFVLAENVRQALDYVARGEAQAGLVYATDAASRADKVKVVLEVGGHAPITYPAAILKTSTQPDAAKTFLDLLQSSEGQATLAQFGFKKP